MTKGYKNEIDFAVAINRKKYCELDENMKKFIKFIFNDIKEDDVLECRRYKMKHKSDVYIKLNGVIKNVSIKSGIRVSVHAEPINDFVKFLKEVKISCNIINYLLLYHYGDFTTNGSGNVRISASELKEKYKREIQIFNKYVNHKNIIKKVITRCLFEGSSGKKVADYIYYGYVPNGIYASRNEIINYFCNNRATEIIAPHFSYLIYQNWNRNIIYNPKLESHRYYCQLKWPSIQEDLIKIRSENI